MLHVTKKNKFNKLIIQLTKLKNNKQQKSII